MNNVSAYLIVLWKKWEGSSLIFLLNILSSFFIHLFIHLFIYCFNFESFFSLLKANIEEMEKALHLFL